MTKKKWLYTAALVLLVSLILYLYNAFNGNPVSKLISQKGLESYLAEQYPEKVLRVREGHYNFKFGEYSFAVIEIGGDTAQGTEPYEFTVRGFINPKVHWDGIYYSRLDEELMGRLEEQAAQEISAFLKREVEHLIMVSVSLEVLEGHLDPGSGWSKDLPLEKPIGIFVVLDAANRSPEDIFNTAVQIQESLNREGYDYDRVNINANVMGAETGKEATGYLKYALDFEKNSDIKLGDVTEYNQ